MRALELTELTGLMARTKGSPDIAIGLIDGPVATTHPALAGARLRQIGPGAGPACVEPESLACLHGTFVAGILCAAPESGAPGICPGCTLLMRPIFPEAAPGRHSVPAATPAELGAAIADCVSAGARVINLSLGLAAPSTRGDRGLEQALGAALRGGVLVVAAAGNQGGLATSAITRHPWVIPVVACDSGGRPTSDSNLGGSIGRRGLSAPGDRVTSLSPDGANATLGGTSVAAPFVAGACALLWSEFPSATAAQIRQAVVQSAAPRRASVVPPLLNAAAAYTFLSNSITRGWWHDQEQRQTA